MDSIGFDIGLYGTYYWYLSVYHHNYLSQVIEVLGGFYAHSLAIMTDAAHLLTDIAAFLLSLFAMWLASRPKTDEMSYGFHRAEILGSVASVLMIWALTGILVYEAVNRVITIVRNEPLEVDGKVMFIVASGGLLISTSLICPSRGFFLAVNSWCRSRGCIHSTLGRPRTCTWR